MIERVHSKLVSTLSSIEHLYVDRYYGQLSDYNSPALEKEELPKILVDFVGDQREGMQRVLYFNLYFVHITYSAHKDYRQASLQELSVLLEEAEKALDGISDFLVLSQRSKKLFDAAVKEGYLSIFSRQIAVHITDEGVLG